MRIQVIMRDGSMALVEKGMTWCLNHNGDLLVQTEEGNGKFRTKMAIGAGNWGIINELTDEDGDRLQSELQGIQMTQAERRPPAGVQ